jgi:O-antigen ligase
MVINSLESKEQIKRFIIAIFITSLIISIISILQIPSGERVSAPFEGEIGEPNTLGGYLVLILSIALGLILTIKERIEKRVLIGLCLIIIPPFLFTLSRSSWISLLPMLMVLIFFTEKKALLIGSTVFIILLGISMAPEPVEERIRYTFKGEIGYTETERVLGISLDPSTSARISRFKHSIKNWLKHPIIGWGVTGGGFIDGQYNRILEETGILGLLGFLWLIYSVLRYTFLSFRGSDDLFLKGLSLGMIAGIAALLGHALGSNTFIIVRIMEPFWFLVGIVVSIPRILNSTPKEV